MLVQDQILNFLQATGPTLPAKVAKNIGTEIFIASAHLSDLASQGKIKISSLKVGSSPLYFLPEHEDQLFRFASGNMNPKNLVVLERLRHQKVMRESELDMLSKVALRSLKDFAVPLNVNYQGKIELFWKWHLLPGDAANNTISLLLKDHEPVKPEIIAEPIEEVKEEVVEIEEEIKEPEKEEPKEEIKPEVPEQEIEPVEEPAKVEGVKEVETPVVAEKHSKPKEKEVQKPKEKQKKLIPKKTSKKKKDDFVPQIESMFKELEIRIKEFEIIRKNSETNFLVEVPSIVGNMKYFCKAKSKSKCDEKDISAAYMEAQIKKLPLLFIHTGEITKKAQDMLDTGVFENVVLKKVK